MHVELTAEDKSMTLTQHIERRMEMDPPEMFLDKAYYSRKQMIEDLNIIGRAFMDSFVEVCKGLGMVALSTKQKAAKMRKVMKNIT